VRLACPRDFEHLSREVDAKHFPRTHSFQRSGKRQRQVTCAARDIDDGLSAAERCRADREASPRLVAPNRVQAVVQVVGRRDRREHLAHAHGLVGRRMDIAREITLPPCRRH